MENYQRSEQFKIGKKCSVSNCENEADFEVVLYDLYDYPGESIVFYEQDYTCPFLCAKHLDINEKNAKGERKPRGYVHYPYTNQYGAQGYNKYNPIKELYPELFSSKEIENNPNIQIELNEINEELIKYLARHPEFMRELHHRKFEELIAEIIRSKGYEVTLTPKTRDGGKDIIALYKSPFGHQMFVIECKKHKAENKVGVEIVRGLYGVKIADKATKGIVVTSSTFTRNAIEFVKPLQFELELSDYNDVAQWCKDYK